MTRGYTDVHFIGDSQDGKSHEQVSTRSLPKELLFRKEAYFAYDQKGIFIAKGDIKDNWHSFNVEVYLKEEYQKLKEGTAYIPIYGLLPYCNNKFIK